LQRAEQRQLPVGHLSEETQGLRRGEKRRRRRRRRKTKSRKSSPKSAVDSVATVVGTSRFASVSSYGVFFHKRKLRTFYMTDNKDISSDIHRRNLAETPLVGRGAQNQP
jgi:hypothetical protein